MLNNLRLANSQNLIQDGLEKFKSVSKWKPPPSHWYKINVDAATNSKEDRAGIGVIISNEMGKVMVAAIYPSKLLNDVEFMEANAMLKGIELASDTGLSPIIIESDAFNVVKLVNGILRSRSEVGWMVDNIKKALPTQNSYKVEYVARSCNGVAHQLAKLALINSKKKNLDRSSRRNL